MTDMFVVNNKWPNTKAALGTRFFAHSMREFLDREAFEGFRAYSLDTVGRLREAAALLEDIIAKRVREAALHSVLQELVWSIENDAAANTIAPNQCALFLRLCKPNTQKLSLLHCCRMLEKRLLPKYREELINRVISTINEDKRIEILASTGFLCSHFLNEGHNRDYMIYLIEGRFFSTEVKRVGAAVVRNFIKSITDTGRKWIVAHRVSPTMRSLLREFDDWAIHPLDELPIHAHDAAGKWHGYVKGASYATKKVRASDPFAAALEVRKALDEIKSLRLLALESLELSWSTESYVYTPRAKEGHDIFTVAIPLIGEPDAKPISGHRMRQARSLASRIYGNFDDPSKERISRALSSGAIAIDTPQDEIRLTSLWSAVEILMGDPPEGKSRIAHFIEAMGPCVSIRYHRRLFVALHDQLTVRYKSKYRKLLNRFTSKIKSNDHTIFAKIVVLKANEDIFKDILSLCADDPYLLHRVWRLYKYYANPADCYKTIFGHNQRVIWQLNRIYRVRNSLLHAGMSPTYTDTLVANTLEYIRSTVITSSRMAAKSYSSGDIGQIIAEIGFEWEAMLEDLQSEKSGAFDERLAHRVFSAL